MAENGNHRVAGAVARVAIPMAAALAAALAADAPAVPVDGGPVPAQSGPCALDEYAWSDPRRVRLPDGLREVSGLAVLDRAHLLAHDDERGVVAIMDAGSGGQVGQFALGPGLTRDDFEGIAVLGDRVYLATSTGRLYDAPVGRDGRTVPYRVRDTGLGPVCEVEGLAADPAARSLLLSCKEPRARSLRGQVTVFAWSVDRAELDGERFRSPVSRLRAGNAESFRPSAVEVRPGGGLLLLSGADRAIAAVTAAGAVQCVRRLDPAHRQAEGLARLPDGSLVIADEGDPPRLTFYRARTR